jgi:hypothetical protein
MCHGTFVNLTIVYCSGCTSLTTIPDSLVNLGCLLCDGCTSLTVLPDTLVNLKRLDCRGTNKSIKFNPYFGFKVRSIMKPG